MPNLWYWYVSNIGQVKEAGMAKKKSYKGSYHCIRCKRNHRKGSKIAKAHATGVFAAYFGK